MNQKQWTELSDALRGVNKTLSTGLIVDSPWMPGYCGVDNLDFYALPEVWFRCYGKLRQDFPDVLFLPGWWSEYGMATEPSGFGCRLDFYADNLPVVHHILSDTDDEDAIRALKVPDPRKNGLMPLLLKTQKAMQPRIRELGEDYYFVSSRGPLTIASHLMPLTELLIGVKTNGEAVHRLLRVTAQLCRDWLYAQLENVGSARGILVLDDVTGFLNDEDYREFAHPYLKEIFSAFPELVHFYHNDTASSRCYPYLESLGVDLFNFSHEIDIGAARQMIGGRVCLLGNVPPMALAKRTPEEVEALTDRVIDRYAEANGGDLRGLIVSTGGGMPMGAGRAQTEALCRAVRRRRVEGP